MDPPPAAGDRFVESCEQEVYCGLNRGEAGRCHTYRYRQRVNALRSAAEQVTHRFVFRRRLPASLDRVGVYASTEGGLRFATRRSSRLDPMIFSVVDRYVRPGDRVWDIGANVGLFSAASAVRAGPAGHVTAVEADPWMARLLLKTAGHLPPTVAPMTVLCAAASSAYGIARFHIAQRSRATNFLEGFGTTQTGGTRSSVLVPTFPTDALAAEGPPAFVKIDVEGAEELVLRGLSQTLREHRPHLLCEVAAVNAASVTRILHDAAYSLLDATDGFKPVAAATPEILGIPIR